MQWQGLWEGRFSRQYSGDRRWTVVGPGGRDLEGVAVLMKGLFIWSFRHLFQCGPVCVWSCTYSRFSSGEEHFHYFAVSCCDVRSEKPNGLSPLNQVSVNFNFVVTKTEWSPYQFCTTPKHASLQVGNPATAEKVAALYNTKYNPFNKKKKKFF